MDFLIKSDPMRYTLGVVYAPEEKDSQDDIASAEEIEKACHGFMRHIQRGSKKIKKGALGFMHKDFDDANGDIVECYIAPCDMIINNQPVTKGSWLLGAVWNEDIFQKIDAGEINGYSMGGTGTRELVNEIAKHAGHEDEKELERYFTFPDEEEEPEKPKPSKFKKALMDIIEASAEPGDGLMQAITKYTHAPGGGRLPERRAE